MGKNVNYNVEVNIDNNVLNYLYPNNNDMISQMTNSDKLYMTYLIKQYYLELRQKLNIISDATFGLEIEFDNANMLLLEIMLQNVDESNNWILKEDGSLPLGGEIVSPILKDDINSWIELEKICNVVSNYAYESDNAGSHIHIGMHILGNNPKYWRNFVLLWMTYENVIFRFLNGEYLSSRSGIEDQAKPVAKKLIDDLDRINDRTKMKNAFYLMKVLDSGNSYKERRKRSVNFTNVSDIEPYKYNIVGEKNTIEFRSPNCTFNPIIWQNNVNFLVKLFEYAKNDSFRF